MESVRLGKNPMDLCQQHAGGEDLYHALFTAMAQGVVCQDTAGQVVYANPAAERILGLSLDQLTERTSGDPRWRSIREDGSPFPGDAHPTMQALRTGKESEAIMGVLHPSTNSYRWIKIHAVPEFREGEKGPFRVFATFDDITQLRAAHQRIAHLRSVTHALRDIAKLTIHEKTPEKLIMGACSALTESMGCCTAWGCLFAGPGLNGVSWTSNSGFNGRFQAMHTQLMHGDFPRCMRQSLSSNKLHVVRSPATECPECPLSAGHEGCSGLSCRLAHNGKDYGFLAVSVPAAYAQDAEEQALILELAGDLGFALYRLEVEANIHRLENVLATVPNPLSFISPDYRYLAVNDAYEGLCQTPRNQILGHHVADFLGADVFEREVKPCLDQCLAGQNVTYDIKVEFHDGSERWMQMHYLPYRSPDGRIAGVVSHGLDVTERRNTEEELRFQAILLSNIRDSVIATDLNGTITFANQAACQLLGRPRCELLGRPTAILGEDATGTKQEEIARRTLSEGEWRGDVINTTSSGEKVILDCRTRLFRGQSGVPEGMVGISTDITERRRMEGQLERAKRLESVGRLAGGIAHDFNNMLGGIIGYTEMSLGLVHPGTRRGNRPGVGDRIWHRQAEPRLYRSPERRRNRLHVHDLPRATPGRGTARVRLSATRPDRRDGNDTPG